jgi:hypothetical protein
MQLQCFSIVLLLGTSLSAIGQQKSPSVIAAAGDRSKAGNIVLEWTVGEMAIETIATRSGMYTQGFHQPVLQIEKQNHRDNIVQTNHSILVYPNPTTAIINIQLNKASETPLVVSFMDVTGKLLLTNTIPANSRLEKINVSRYTQGTYVLRITDATGTLQGEYKIIKAQ